MRASYNVLQLNIDPNNLSYFDPEFTNNWSYYFWHFSKSCYENAQLLQFTQNTPESYRYVINHPLPLKVYVYKDDKCYYPCPFCVVQRAIHPLLGCDIKVTNIRAIETNKKEVKEITNREVMVPDPLTGVLFHVEAFTKPQLVHFPNGGGTYWVLKNPKGGWDKVRDMTRDEEISYLPNRGNFSYWSTTNKKGYDGFEDSNGFLATSYKNSFIWNIKAQDWDEIKGQIYNNATRTDL